MTEFTELQIHNVFDALENGKFIGGYYTQSKDADEVLNDLKAMDERVYNAAKQINNLIPVRFFQLCNDEVLKKRALPVCLRNTAWWQVGEPVPINGIITYWRNRWTQFRICLFDCRQRGWIVEDEEELEMDMSDLVASVTDEQGLFQFMTQDNFVSRCEHLSQFGEMSVWDIIRRY